MDNVLIATFYNLQPFLPAVVEFAPRKIVLLVDDDGKEVAKNIRTAREAVGKVVNVEVKKVPKDDLYAGAKATVLIIDENKTPGTRLIMSVAGGSRSLATSAMLGCYARRDRVYKLVARGIKDNKIISLPKLAYNIGSTKAELLRKLEDRRGRTISQIAKEMRRTRGMIYQHLKELKDYGYLDDDYTVTDAGKLALL